MSTIFIYHHYSGDPQGNGSRVMRIARDLAVKGRFALAPQIYFPGFVDEATERERALRLNACASLKKKRPPPHL